MKKLIRKVTANKKATSRNLIVSSKSNNKKAIMAGAGSGISLDIGSIFFNNVQESAFKGGTLTGKAVGSVEIISIGTYYDGGKIERDCPCEIEFNLTDDTRNLKEDLEEYGIDDILSSLEYDMEATIGGGWLRSTFDGTFSIDCWDYDTVGTFSITITDADFVSYLDKVAHGDDIYTVYEIYINDNPQGNLYEDLDEAIESADLYADDGDEVCVVRSDYREFYNGDSELVHDAVVWDNFSDEDIYDENYD